MQSAEGTIVAPATVAGRSAAAILRISGPDAFAIAQALFRKRLEAQPREMIYGTLRDAATGDVIDHCLAVAFPGPRSFTGEDVVEFHLHGAQPILRWALDACLAAGARLATPGEFSYRAFMNGKLDLSQAEGIANLIDSRTNAAARASQAVLAGGLRQRIAEARKAVLGVLAELEAALDFADEDIEFIAHENALAALASNEAEIRGLLDKARHGRLLREGARVALVGLPNCGKSSLLNALSGEERAIVSATPGTTRDTIEESIDLFGIPLVLVDTAGLRETSDAIEGEGIRRARKALSEADLVCLLLDGSEPLSHEARALLNEVAALDRAMPRLLLRTKADLPTRLELQNEQFAHDLSISSKSGAGLDHLKRTMAEALAMNTESSADEMLVGSARQQSALELALHALAAAQESLRERRGDELVAVDLRRCLAELSEITGEAAPQELLDEIFSRFCLGK